MLKKGIAMFVIENFLWPTKGAYNIKIDYRILTAYYVLGVSLMVLINYIIDNYMTLEGNFLADLFLESLASFWLSSMFFVLLFALLALALNLGIMHYAARLLGGTGTLTDSLTVVSLGATPLVLIGWFPCLGQFSYLIVLANYFTGIRELHNLSKAKAALVVLSPLIALFFVIAIILFYIFNSGNISG